MSLTIQIWGHDWRHITDLKTHWGRDKMAVILQTTFSNAFSWMQMYEFRLRFHWSLFLTASIGSDNGLAPTRRQAIIWTNYGIVCWRIYTSLGLNELNAITTMEWFLTLQWRHNEPDCVSNHQPHDCLLNRLFRRRSKKTSKLRVTGLCAGNSPGTGEFPAQRASNAENFSIWWRHHGTHKRELTKRFLMALIGCTAGAKVLTLIKQF